jgi:hypothetical protein
MNKVNKRIQSARVRVRNRGGKTCVVVASEPQGARRCGGWDRIQLICEHTTLEGSSSRLKQLLALSKFYQSACGNVDDETL